MKTLALRDIIGPIMVGPSSSHTAGALRIAAMARELCEGSPRKVEFRLLGSFAHTFRGHGTDKALVAGMLGLATDDLRVRDSFTLAQEAGLAFSFVPEPDDEGYDHPNTIDVAVEDESGATTRVRGESIGGGAAVLREINGIEVRVTGEHTNVVVRQRDKAGVLAHIATCLSEGGVNIATASMYRQKRGDAAFTVLETDEAVPEDVRRRIGSHPDIVGVRVIPGDAAAQASAQAACGAGGNEGEERFDAADFANAEELLRLCEREGRNVSEAFLAREAALDEALGRRSDAQDYLARALRVMREAACGPVCAPACSMGGLIGGEARKLDELSRRGGGACTGELSRAVTYAMAVLETNASMGRIVAAPTAGSAGVVPGVLLALQEERGLSDEEVERALSCAAAVGYLVTRNATVSGAEGGCQAEVGTASAMAAAAACELAGGTPEQCLNAAANALSSLLGMVCDPVAGLVEVPCQKRNAAGAAVALASAQVALAGIGNLVGFDETVEAMRKVGDTLPFELRESALGGLAATPAACTWCAGKRGACA